MKINIRLVVIGFLGLLVLTGFIQFINSSFLNVEQDPMNIEEDEEFDIIIDPIPAYPTYPGCEGIEQHQEKYKCFHEGIMKYIKSIFQYPPLALKLELEDKVYVQFVIDEEGSVDDIKVVRGEYEVLNAYTIQMIKKLPKMQPAIQNGQAIRTMFTLPIKYNLANKK